MRQPIFCQLLLASERWCPPREVTETCASPGYSFSQEGAGKELGGSWGLPTCLSLGLSSSSPPRARGCWVSQALQAAGTSHVPSQRLCSRSQEETPAQGMRLGHRAVGICWEGGPHLRPEDRDVVLYASKSLRASPSLGTGTNLVPAQGWRSIWRSFPA